MDPTAGFLPEPKSPHVVTIPSQSTWILFSLLGIFSVVVAWSGLSLSCLSGLPGFPDLHLIREAIGGVSFIETVSRHQQASSLALFTEVALESAVWAALCLPTALLPSRRTGPEPQNEVVQRHRAHPGEVQ